MRCCNYDTFVGSAYGPHLKPFDDRVEVSWPSAVNNNRATGDDADTNVYYKLEFLDLSWIRAVGMSNPIDYDWTNYLNNKINSMDGILLNDA